MSDPRYIFTVTNGRSAQASFSKILSESLKSSYVAFEEPQINTFFSGFIGDLERKFRRLFIETHELLGRGKVLTSYSNGDYDYIDCIVNKRLYSINNFMRINNKNTYIDVSKYFSRGLHYSYMKSFDKVSLIHLVRDPIANMRSFVNRNKIFLLDNNLPDEKSNLFTLNSSNLKKEEFYLWSWVETYLRYEKLKKYSNVESYTEVRSEKIDDAHYLGSKLDDLNIEYKNIFKLSDRVNTNAQKGFQKTVVSKSDILLFNKFLEKVPNNLLKLIPYLDDYDPYVVHEFK